MPHFLSYLTKLDYGKIFEDSKNYISEKISHTVHDAVEEDILTSLELCGFIYTSDDHKDPIANAKRNFFSFLKSLVVYLSTIKLFILMFLPVENKWVLYLGDFSINAGGIRTYFLLYFLLWGIWTIFIMSLYHKSNYNPKYNKWLIPFVDLSDHFAIDTEKKAKFFKFYRLIQKIFFTVKILNLFFCTLTILIIYLEKINLIQFVSYGIFSLVFNVYNIYVTQSVFFTSHLILFLIPYFVKLRFTFVTEEFEEYRHDVEDLHLEVNIEKLNVMIEHYNTLCREFIEYNYFLSYIFGLNLVFITTSSCLLLYLVFFTEITYVYYGFYMFYLVFTFITCICVPCYLAINAKHEAKTIYSIIFRLMLFKIQIKTKYNLVTIIENQKTERLGFSVFTLFQINTNNFVRYLLEISCMILLLVKTNY